MRTHVCTNRASRLAAAVLAVCLLPVAAWPQAAGTAKPARTGAPRTGAAATRPPAPAPVAAPAPDAYSYRSEGRRDPFVSLVDRGIDRDKGKQPPEGLRGIYASDLVLKGILQSRAGYLAIVQGPDAKRPYIVRTNDRLADGVVRAITADSMLILQEVNDPLSLTKQREIRKTLRVVEEVK